MNQPTIQTLLHKQLAAYRRLNEWETAERSQQLPHLTVEESIRQYLAMCELAGRMAAVPPPVLDPQKMAHWRQRAQMVYTHLRQVENQRGSDDTRPATSSF